MLKAIEFTDKRFKKEDDYNLINPLLNNTIILCNNYKLMDSLAKEIFDTVNGNAEHNFYECADKDIGNAQMQLSFGLQRIININRQKITLALEPAIIYKAGAIEEIWLFDSAGIHNSDVNPYREFIYPLCMYEGTCEKWQTDKDELYRMICNGRCGTYDGKWVDLGLDHHGDYRVSM